MKAERQSLQSYCIFKGATRFRDWDSGCKVYGFGFQALGFKASGSGVLIRLQEGPQTFDTQSPRRRAVWSGQVQLVQGLQASKQESSSQTQPNLAPAWSKQMQKKTNAPGHAPLNPKPSTLTASGPCQGPPQTLPGSRRLPMPGACQC